MSALISVDKVIGNTLYAKSATKKYRIPGGTVIGTYAPGALIGVVYSYLLRDDGLWWMFYDTLNQPYYVKQSSDLELPAAKQILADAAAAADQKQRDDKGLLQYNIDKYGKWIVGGIVVAVALPTLLRVIQNRKQSAVSGTQNKQGLLLLLMLGGAVYAYSQSNKKKLKGSLIIPPLDKGEYGPSDIDATLFFDTTKFLAGNKRPAVPLTI